MTGLTEKSFALLAALEADNSKEWFDAHRDEMREFVQRPFAELLETVTARLAETAIPLKGGEHTMFRMNRDVRFSKDKSPYSTHVSGVLTRGGTKKEDDGLSYLHMDARGGFIASGFYNLEPKALAPIRDRIVERPAEFEDAVEAITAAGFELSRDDVLSGMPQGYAQHADAPFADYLKLKSLTVCSLLSKSAWMSGDVVDRAVKMTEAAAALIAFGRAAR
jgi:uncharacterized protein (TIGR02453 family)